MTDLTKRRFRGRTGLGDARDRRAGAAEASALDYNSTIEHPDGLLGVKTPPGSALQAGPEGLDVCTAGAIGKNQQNELVVNTGDAISDKDGKLEVIPAPAVDDFALAFPTAPTLAELTTDVASLTDKLNELLGNLADGKLLENKANP